MCAGGEMANIGSRLLCTLIGYTLIFWTLIISFWVQCAAVLFICPFLSHVESKMLLGLIFRYICGFVTRLNPFWRLEVLGPRPKTQPTRTIVMVNHLSNADAFFLSRALLPYETKYIAKGSLFSVPFGGWAMRLAGDLPVYFTKEKDGWGVKKGTVKKMMDTVKVYLRQGMSVTVFPEGGRSEDGKLRPLKDGFFHTAVEMQADILPCAIVGTERAWPIYQALMGPADVFVRIGAPIPSKGETHESLKEKVKAAIEALEDDLPISVPRVKRKEHEEKNGKGSSDAQQKDQVGVGQAAPAESVDENRAAT